MKVLGLDYGRSKIGLAVAESGSLPYPLQVLKVKGALPMGRLADLIKESGVEKVVVGVSEGRMKMETLAFVSRLKGYLKNRGIKVEIVTWDETLSTREAERLSIEAGIGRKKRKKMEDAYAAALILENYLRG